MKRQGQRPKVTGLTVHRTAQVFLRLWGLPGCRDPRQQGGLHLRRWPPYSGSVLHRPTLAATDVDYRPSADGRQPDSARAAAVLFSDWANESPAHDLVARVDRVQPYTPGEFYRRELPCLLAVLDLAAQVAGPLGAVIIDGYVTLDSSGRAGLGLHLYRALGEHVPVIGVAKTAFQGSAHALALRRGHSGSPLYITAAGLEVQRAARLIATMAGPHRLPTLLKRADQLCRGAE